MRDGGVRGARGQQVFRYGRQRERRPVCSLCEKNNRESGHKLRRSQIYERGLSGEENCNVGISVRSRSCRLREVKKVKEPRHTKGCDPGHRTWLSKTGGLTRHSRHIYICRLMRAGKSAEEPKKTKRYSIS